MGRRQNFYTRVSCIKQDKCRNISKYGGAQLNVELLNDIIKCINTKCFTLKLIIYFDPFSSI